ncbi:DUF6417 family protein [Streptomyces sp. NPDC001275]
MDDYDLFALRTLDFDAVQQTPQRLALTLDKAHDLLRLLVTVAQDEGSMAEADRLAKETA